MSAITYGSGELLQEIDQLKKEIEHHRQELDLKLHNQRRATLEKEALNSSYYIEFPERRGSPKGRKDREAKKLIGRLNTAWRYCLDNVGCDSRLNQRDLEVIQAIIVPEGKLGLRQEDLTINLREKVDPPPFEEVLPLMQELFENLRQYRSKLHPVEYAAYLHLHLLYIHPFLDGNGRTARLTQNFLLNQSGYVPAIIEPYERLFYFTLVRDGITEGIILGEIKSQRHFYEFVATKVQQGLEKVLA